MIQLDTLYLEDNNLPGNSVAVLQNFIDLEHLELGGNSQICTGHIASLQGYLVDCYISTGYDSSDGSGSDSGSGSGSDA